MAESSNVYYHAIGNSEHDDSQSGTSEKGMTRIYTAYKARSSIVRRAWIRRAVLATSAMVVFYIGFLLGSAGTLSTAISKSIKVTANSITALSDSPSSPHALPSFFDALRSLPPVDLKKVYGLDPESLNAYPPLGKKVCILNVDTRRWDFSDGLQSRHLGQWGLLNHYMYAQTHGYDYKFIEVPETSGEHSTWVKLQELHRTVIRGDYDFVVLTDSDLIFPDMRLPMETLLAYWNITSDIAIAGAIDPPEEWNTDSHGEYNMNTGFIIAQNTSRFNDLMLDWINCPTNVKYPDCSKYLQLLFHEQSAFSDFVRYDYNESVRHIEYSDANGCEGKFVRHLWCNKSGLADIVQDQLIQFINLIMPGTVRSLSDHWKQHHVDRVHWPEDALPGISTVFTARPPPPSPVVQEGNEAKATAHISAEVSTRTKEWSAKPMPIS